MAKGPVFWQYAPVRLPDELIRAGIPYLVAMVLSARGYDAAAARDFISPDTAGWWKRWLVFEPELVKAGQAILEAARRQEGILVSGDYDADGLCATSLLKTFLHKELGVQRVYHYLPTRVDGYGFLPAAVEKARELGCSLIITADCGTNHHETCRLADRAGIRVVVTDHHIPLNGRPPAWAVFNPRLVEPGAADQPCGAGAAYLLARGTSLLAGRQVPRFDDHYAVLAAIATVADVVPLVGGNRALVREGLRRWPQVSTHLPGLRALCLCAGIKQLDSEAIAYYLAPRINAANRLGDPEDALALLLTEDPDLAQELATRLDRLNRTRQETVTRSLEEIRGRPEVSTGRILVTGTTAPAGIAGLLAGKLAEEHNCPAIIVNTETGQGSGRAPKGYSLVKLLEQVADMLIDFGGHEQACGLRMDPAQLNRLRERLDRLAPEPQPVVLAADGVIDPSLCSVEEVNALNGLLEPYGAGNPRPVFLLRTTRPVEVRALGANGEHTCFYAGGLRVVWFGRSAQEVLNSPLLDLAVHLEVNDYFNPPVVQATVVDQAQPHPS